MRVDVFHTKEERMRVSYLFLKRLERSIFEGEEVMKSSSLYVLSWRCF